MSTDDPHSPSRKEESSSSTAASSEDNKKYSQRQRKSIIFPWREHATEPISRLLIKDDLSGIPNTTRSRFMKKFTVGMEMKVPFWQLFLTGSWERELAQNCSWAFRIALAGLLSRAFQVPLSSIENNSKFLKFDYNGQLMSMAADAGTAAKLNDSSVDLKVENENGNGNEYVVEAMVEETLLQLYTHKHNDVVLHDEGEQVIDDKPYKDKHVRAHLYLEPLHSTLENIFLVPSLTRDDVKDDESLRGAYTAIEREFYETGDVKIISKMANDLIHRVSHRGTKRSVIMDISINCLETFFIKQGEELLQGDDQRGQEEVTHLVRFEMQTTKGLTTNNRDRVLGSWYIIDIDDHLHGNVWH